MIGTLVNTATILIGSCIGSALRHGLKEKYQQILFSAMGLAAAGLGINAFVQNMPYSQYPVLFIASLALGGVVGSALRLDERFKGFINKRSASESHLHEGLSTAILLFCVGTLSILGPINSALYHDETFLFTNAMLDLVTSMVLASTYGIGIALAAPVLLLWQSSLYVIGLLMAETIPSTLMTEVSIVGGFLILASGLSILDIKKIPTINFLPSLVIPVIWFALVEVFHALVH